jgi:hypothetical protein
MSKMKVGSFVVVSSERENYLGVINASTEASMLLSGARRFDGDPVCIATAGLTDSEHFTSEKIEEIFFPRIDFALLVSDEISESLKSLMEN